MSVVVYICIIFVVVIDFAIGFANINHHASQSLITSYTSQLYAKGGGGKKNKSKRQAQTTKGFGVPPPKLEYVLSTFKSRMPEDADAQECCCGSGKVYADCCGPFHRGDKSCLTMTDVLRSRYTAFSWRNIKYILDTTHETCRDWREDNVAWAKDMDKGGMFDSFEFVNLSAGPEEMSEDDENEGYVEFKVTLRAKEDKNDEVAGQETVISERSRFIRNPDDGSWSYASGDVKADVAGLEEVLLNV